MDVLRLTKIETTSAMHCFSVDGGTGLHCRDLGVVRLGLRQDWELPRKGKGQHLLQQPWIRLYIRGSEEPRIQLLNTWIRSDVCHRQTKSEDCRIATKVVGTCTCTFRRPDGNQGRRFLEYDAEYSVKLTIRDGAHSQWTKSRLCQWYLPCVPEARDIGQISA